MSKPGNAAAQDSTQNPEPTFEQQVNEVVSNMTQNEKGIYELPNVDLPEPVKFAAMAEKRRRDAQSALGKTQAELTAEKAARQVLEEKALQNLTLSLSFEEQDRLDTLKHEDPDTWRKEMNALEASAHESVSTAVKTASADAIKQTEEARRKAVLVQFNAEHSDAPITDAALENDIPPRIVKKLETGKVSFEEFLEEAYNYLTTPKIVKDAEFTASPNLGKAGGGDSPTDEGPTTSSSYTDAVF